ncbi:MAG: 16S rRNA (adenine(1518)-N(6)/adenine(1519)-N(6))-dimethyltransferase RsmA [Gammaproteobacteria bacterium]
MKARKHLGQNFLVDGNIIRKIIAAIGPRPGEHFVEIGPGRGALTVPLLAAGVRLDAIEIDTDLARELPQRIAAGLAANTSSSAETRHSTDSDRFRIHCANALQFDFRQLVSGNAMRLAANLPYNISTPLLFHLLDQGTAFSDLHVMLQKEVGDRMVSEPGNKVYGRLTIAIALRCSVERLFDIQPGSFRPAPKVESVMLRLKPHAQPLADDAVLARADQLVAQAFTMRRKRLSNGLRGLLTPAEIRSVDLDDGDRPEQLAPQAWLRLAALANPTTRLPE